MLRVEVQRLNVAKREAEARAAANQARRMLTLACRVGGANARLVATLTCHGR